MKDLLNQPATKLTEKEIDSLENQYPELNGPYFPFKMEISYNEKTEISIYLFIINNAMYKVISDPNKGDSWFKIN